MMRRDLDDHPGRPRARRQTLPCRSPFGHLARGC